MADKRVIISAFWCTNCRNGATTGTKFMAGAGVVSGMSSMGGGDGVGPLSYGVK